VPESGRENQNALTLLTLLLGVVLIGVKTLTRNTGGAYGDGFNTGGTLIESIETIRHLETPSLRRQDNLVVSG